MRHPGFADGVDMLVQSRLELLGYAFEHLDFEGTVDVMPKRLHPCQQMHTSFDRLRGQWSVYCANVVVVIVVDIVVTVVGVGIVVVVRVGNAVVDGPVVSTPIVLEGMRRVLRNLVWLFVGEHMLLGDRHTVALLAGLVIVVTCCIIVEVVLRLPIWLNKAEKVEQKIYLFSFKS